jgi:hypothetical protein
MPAPPKAKAPIVTGFRHGGSTTVATETLPSLLRLGAGVGRVFELESDVDRLASFKVMVFLAV